MRSTKLALLFTMLLAASVLSGCECKSSPEIYTETGGESIPATDDDDKTPAIRRNVVRKTLLATHPNFEKTKRKLWTVSPDLRHIVLVLRNEGLLIDGELDAKFKGCNHIYFSPDGSKLAYEAYDEDGWYITLNGEIGPRCDGIERVFFSRNSESWGYIASDENGSFVSVNGVESQRYGYIGEERIIFSPDGCRFAFVARKDRMAWVVLDWEEKAPVKGDIESLTFSPDGSRFAYVVINDDDFSGENVVVDDVPEQTFGVVKYQSIVFSPSGRHYAYSAATGYYKEEDDKMFIVLDGKKLVEFDAPGWSADDRIGIGSTVFSKDEKRMAYRVVYQSQSFVVMDGIKGKEYPWVSNPFFTTSGSCVYSARDPDYKIRSVVDGIERETHKWEYDSSPILDMKSGGEVGFFLTGWGGASDHGISRAGNPPPGWYAKIYDYQVSPNSDFIAYVSEIKKNLQVEGMCVVIDGIEGEIYDTVFHNDGGRTYVIWDSPTTFHYLARDGDKIYLVEEEIVEE